MHGAEEDAADQDPQQHGEPAEHHGRDRAGHRARTADRAELMRERGEARGRREVLAVLHAASGRDRVAIDTPFRRKPPAVSQVARSQHDCCHHHYDDSVHTKVLSPKPIETKRGPSNQSTAPLPQDRPNHRAGLQRTNPYQIISEIIDSVVMVRICSIAFLHRVADGCRLHSLTKQGLVYALANESQIIRFDVTALFLLEIGRLQKGARRSKSP